MCDSADKPTNCGREAVRLAQPSPLTRLRGEDNEMVYQPLGVGIQVGNRDPVVRVIEAVGPVELRIPAHQLVHEQERDLRVAALVECAKCSRRAPRAVACETARAQVARHGRELRQR